MYERDEEGELVRNIVDKVKKKRVTVLKKAILKGRARKKILKDSSSKNLNSESLLDDDINSGYVTIEETLEMFGVILFLHLQLTFLSRNVGLVQLTFQENERTSELSSGDDQILAK